MSKNITLKDEKCRMVVKDLRHYIITILKSFEISNRTPHTYMIMVQDGKKTLQYIEFDKTISKTLKHLQRISNDDGFVDFVGFREIKNIKV